jgi:hypothetical protein
VDGVRRRGVGVFVWGCLGGEAMTMAAEGERWEVSLMSLLGIGEIGCLPLITVVYASVPPIESSVHYLRPSSSSLSFSPNAVSHLFDLVVRHWTRTRAITHREGGRTRGEGVESEGE